MRIDNKQLAREFEISKALKSGKMSLGEYVAWFVDDSSTYHISDRTPFECFCETQIKENMPESERMKAFVMFNRRILSKIYNPFKVECVCDSFYDSMDFAKMASSLDDKCLFDSIGECSGVMLFPEGFMEYAITQEGSLLRWFPNNDECSIVFHFFEEFDYSYFSSIDDDSCLFLCATLEVLLLKKIGEVESVLVAKDVIRAVGDERVVNKMPFPIHRLDSSFFKTITRTEPFMVRGFWRRQRCGKGGKERKLIFIQGFRKNGYTRVAPAEKARSRASA